MTVKASLKACSALEQIFEDNHVSHDDTGKKLGQTLNYGNNDSLYIHYSVLVLGIPQYGKYLKKAAKTVTAWTQSDTVETEIEGVRKPLPLMNHIMQNQPPT